MHSRARGSEGLPDRPLEAPISILKRIIMFPKNGWLSSRRFLSGSLAECWDHVETHEIRPGNSDVFEILELTRGVKSEKCFRDTFFRRCWPFFDLDMTPGTLFGVGVTQNLGQNIEGNGVSVERKFEL